MVVTMSREDAIVEGIVSVARAHLELSDPALLELDREALLGLRLVEDLGLDSIQLLTLAVEVENHFEVALDEFDPGAPIEGDEAPTGPAAPALIETLGSLVDLIGRKKA